jgi:hypothetical protein
MGITMESFGINTHTMYSGTSMVFLVTWASGSKALGISSIDTELEIEKSKSPDWKIPLS